MTGSRTAPNDQAAERALLGSAIIDHRILGRVDGLITHEDYYSPANGAIWEAMCSVARRGHPVDMITVRAELVARGRLDGVGGDEYLLSLTDTIPTTAHAEAYATTVARMSSRRRIAAALLEEYGRANDLSVAHDAWLDSASVSLARAFGAASTGHELTHIGTAVREVVERFQRIAQSGGAGVTGLRTGLDDLDEITTGMHPGEFIIVAGRPGMGKSGLATNLLLTGAAQAAADDACVVTYSLEMPRSDLALRLLAGQAGIGVKGIRSARLGREDLAALGDACSAVSDMPIYASDEAGLTIGAIRSLALRQHAKRRVKLVVVDYLQLMESMERGMSREQAVADASRGMKRLAKELGCPVVGLAQLNRKCEDRPDKRPTKSDLRESGSLEQDADGIWLLYRRGYYAALAAKEAANRAASKASTPRSKFDTVSDIGPGEDDGITEIIVDKNRHGECRSVKCKFVAESIVFQGLERDYRDDDAF